MLKRTAVVVSLMVFAGLAHAQTPARINVRLAQQKAYRNLVVKFVSVPEDSRCPKGAACVWAGNAKVKLEVRKGRGAWKTVELNTNAGATSAVVEGFEIKLVGLDPYPGSGDGSRAYSALIEIKRS